jgi:hypothetical protein
MYYHTVHLIKGYVINLDGRQDRWAEASSQFAKFPFAIERVNAVNSADVEGEESYVPAGVAATWRSHQRAMRTHLETQFEYALILEDDFLLVRDIGKFLVKAHNFYGFDLVQLGYLSPSLLRRSYRYAIGIRDIFLKFLQKINRTIQLNSLNKLLVYEQKNVPISIVLNDIQAGGHCYLVSRKFSAAAQEMNNPCFLSADGMLMSLSETRTFRVGRSRINYVKQSDSISSVQQRFKSSDK